MKNECSIVRDILSLYLEDMLSADTAEFVRGHLESCAECRREYERIMEPEAIKSEAAAMPLMTIKRKLRAKKIQTIAFTALLVIALLVSAFAFLSAPEYFSYSEDIMSLSENEDRSITITFDEKVKNYACEIYLEPREGQARYYYQLEAWTSAWDSWVSKRGMQSITIERKDDLPFSVYYVSNSSEEDVCIYGKALLENGGMITLPRLALGYYLKLALGCLAALLIIWLIWGRKRSIKLWLERIMLYPCAYVLGHLLVLGPKSTSYSMQKDLMLIVFLSVLIYCLMLLIHSILRLKKEIRENMS